MHFGQHGDISNYARIYLRLWIQAGWWLSTLKRNLVCVHVFFFLVLLSWVSRSASVVAADGRPFCDRHKQQMSAKTASRRKKKYLHYFLTVASDIDVNHHARNSERKQWFTDQYLGAAECSIVTLQWMNVTRSHRDYPDFHVHTTQRVKRRSVNYGCYFCIQHIPKAHCISGHCHAPMLKRMQP